MVSVGARGLWIDMICLMHQGSDYGHLKVNHKVILTPNLARMVGATLSETEGWLSELEQAGVFSVAADGCIYSRRMIRDENTRELRASGGILGGNPALKGAAKVNHKVDGKVNLPPNLPPTPSSSSSSSSSNNTQESVFELLKGRIGEWYKRPANQTWNFIEESTLAEIALRTNALDDLALIQKLRGTFSFEDRKRFFPQSVASCLSKWDELCDKARVKGCAPVTPKPTKPTTAKTIAVPTIADLENTIRYYESQTPPNTAQIELFKKRIAAMKGTP